MHRTFFAIAAATLAMTGAAAADTLSAEEIRDHVIGKRIYLSTPFGGEFPLYYTNAGNVTGDGTKLGLGKYFAPKETGRWWIEGSQLCQQWPSWYSGQTFCFTIKKTGGDSIQWNRNDGKTGTARIGI